MGFVSVFSQLLQLFPRIEFQRAVKDHRAERHARGFTCRGRFVAMLFCQLGRAKALREICGGLACTEGKLTHLGITAPKRTTLAYANEHRPWTLYQATFFQLLARCQALAQGRRHEVTVARTLGFPPGSILVFDRGYIGYAWFAELIRQGVVFVTR
jgi:hypothetical protein